MLQDTTRFAATCPACGPVALSPEQMWLVLASVPGHDHYGFDCPSCEMVVRRPANPVVARILQRTVAVEWMHIPAEALEVRDDLPLTVDDLIDLMLTLEQPQLQSS